MKKRHLTILSALAVAAMCVFIFCMSARPGGESGAMSRAIADFIVTHAIPGYNLLPPGDQVAWYEGIHLLIRKLAHFMEFALLGALTANLLERIADGRADACIPTISSRRLLATWGLCTIFAMSDEFHQLFVPGRACLPADVLIDSAGALAGALVFAVILSLVKRLKNS